MSAPLVSMDAAVLVMVAYLLTIAVTCVWLAVLPAIRKGIAAARRRLVIGARVRQPEWRARRLQNGQWVVDRVRR